MTYTSWKHMPGDAVVGTTPFSLDVFVHIPPNGRVLDLGCGNGRVTKIITVRGFETYGVDTNEDAINFAEHDPELSDVRFSVTDGASTGFADEFFHAVTLQGVLACVEKEKRSRILKEIHRVLMPEGILSVAEFGMRENRPELYDADALLTGEYGTQVVRHEDGTEWFRTHNFTEEEIEELFANTGFEIVSKSHPLFPSLLDRGPHEGHQYIVRKV